MEFQHEEYYEANQAAFNAIMSDAEQLVRNAPEPFVAIAEGFGSIPMVLEGNVSPQEVAAEYEARGVALPLEVAEDLADIRNRTEQTVAQTYLAGTLARLTMQAILQHFRFTGERTMPWNPTNDSAAQLLPCHEAVYAAAAKPQADGTTLHVRAVRLQGSWNEAEGFRGEGYTIEHADDYVVHRFSFASLNGFVFEADHSIAPKEDNLLKRCVQTFNRDYNRVATLLMGEFENEDDLSAKLNELRLAYRIVVPKEAVESLLDEVRTRALSVRPAAELSSKYHLGLPDVDELRLLSERLRA